MILLEESARQALIREMEAYDGHEEIEDVAKLYESGWSIAEIAQSKDVPIKSILNVLSGYIGIIPEDIKQARLLADTEEEYFDEIEDDYLDDENDDEI